LVFWQADLYTRAHDPPSAQLVRPVSMKGSESRFSRVRTILALIIWPSMPDGFPLCPSKAEKLKNLEVALNANFHDHIAVQTIPFIQS
jgi:hypothetical protein